MSEQPMPIDHKIKERKKLRDKPGKIPVLADPLEELKKRPTPQEDIGEKRKPPR